MIPKSDYFTTTLNYKKDMNMSSTWDDIQKQKLKRNYKLDIEQYAIIVLTNGNMKNLYNHIYKN